MRAQMALEHVVVDSADVVFYQGTDLTEAMQVFAETSLHGAGVELLVTFAGPDGMETAVLAHCAPFHAVEVDT